MSDKELEPEVNAAGEGGQSLLFHSAPPPRPAATPSGPEAASTSAICDFFAPCDFSPDGLPPLSLQELDMLENQLELDPEGMLSWLEHIQSFRPTLEEARSYFACARAHLEAQEAAQCRLEDNVSGPLTFQSPATGDPRSPVRRSWRSSKDSSDHAGEQEPADYQPFPEERLPPGFTFPGMDLEQIPITPEETQFETMADWARWLIHSARGMLPLPDDHASRFRWHHAPQYAARRFTYPMLEPAPDRPLEVALFSDFGNGLYAPRYIARQLRSARFPYAIHLGDVYYAGTRLEFERHFKAELDPLLPYTRLFTLPGNHEMFSLGGPFLEYIDARRAAFPGFQEQEGSYFCLRGKQFQIIGIDTAWFGRPPLRKPRYQQPALKDWLLARLREGRAANLSNILLSPDHPYRYREDATTDLYGDLLEMVGPPPRGEALVDLWLWGNTHYCALYNRTAEFPFIGSCIGHGGYPYLLSEQHLLEPVVNVPTEVVFIERQPRFPAWTGVRQRKGHVPGNNGYCVAGLRAEGSLELRYIDWMSRLRCRVVLRRVDSHLEIDRTTLQIED